MFDLNVPETLFALQAVRQAAQLVRHVQQALVTPVLTKQDRSPVTVADFTSQALVGSLLSRVFPEDLMVAEEDSAALRAPGSEETLERVTSFLREIVPQADPDKVCTWIDHGRVDTAKRFWTLDPIDGTKGFLRRDQYAVALALVIDGRVQIGVLGCPNLVNGHRPDLEGEGSLVIAVRGQGAWTTSMAALPVSRGDYERLHVSSQNKAAQARLLRSFESGHTNVSQIDLFAQELGIQAEPVRMDSQAKYAVLAAGQGELMLRLLSPDQPKYQEKIWDQAAGSLVLEEAGGCISDLDGKALDFTTGRALCNNRGILASNTHLHASALAALKAVDA